MSDASRDANRVSALVANSNDGARTPVDLYADPSTHRLLVNATITGAASDGSIVDGVDTSIKATVFSFTNSKPLAVVLRDTAGDYVSVGGGTQYTEDAVAAANPTGTVVNLIRQDTPADEVTANGKNISQRGTKYGASYAQIVTSAGAFVDTFGGGSQYADGAVRGTATGTLAMVDDGTNIQSLSGDATGKLNVNNISGTISLPTGAATAANQQTNALTDAQLRATAVPVSGTVTSNIGTTNGLALDATLTGGTAKAIARGGAKGTTVAADITSNPVDANTQALHVDGSKVIQPVSGTVTTTPPANASTNIAQVNGITVLTGTGAQGTGSARVTVAVDSATVAGSASLPAGVNNIGDVDVLTVNGVAPAFGSGVRGATVQRVTVATDDLVPVSGTVSITANSAVNLAQVAGTNTVTGGVAGLLAVAGNVANAVAATANPVPVGGIFTTTPATLLTGQTATAQFTAAQNLKIDLSGSAANVTAGLLSMKIDQTTPGTTNNISLSVSTGAGTAALVKDDPSFGDGLTTGLASIHPRIYNGTTYDRVRSASTVAGTTGTGLLGAGVLGFDGTNYQRIKTDTAGVVLSTPTPSTSGGWTTFHLVSAATTNATNIKASAGQLGGWFIYNSNAAARKLVFHNTAAAPTAGASVFFSIVIPPTSGANVEFTNGIPFSTGIAITTVTGLADTDSVAVALNDLIINLWYK